MFGDPIYNSTGLCLSFSYLFSTKSESSLTVFVLTSSNSSIWRLNGFHGDSWHRAQVQFAINGNFMVTTYFNLKVFFLSLFYCPVCLTVILVPLFIVSNCRFYLSLVGKTLQVLITSQLTRLTLHQNHVIEFHSTVILVGINRNNRAVICYTVLYNNPSYSRILIGPCL